MSILNTKVVQYITIERLIYLIIQPDETTFTTILFTLRGNIGEKYTKNTCVNGVKNVAKNIEKELFGYKLNGNMIETKQTYKNAVNADCRSAECQRALTQSTCNAGGGWTDLLDEKEFEISQLRFDWLKAGKGIEIKLAGNLTTHKHIQYETSLVVPLLNQEE